MTRSSSRTTASSSVHTHAHTHALCESVSGSQAQAQLRRPLAPKLIIDSDAYRCSNFSTESDELDRDPSMPSSPSSVSSDTSTESWSNMSQLSQSVNRGAVTRHPEYYIDNGDVVFLVRINVLIRQYLHAHIHRQIPRHRMPALCVALCYHCYRIAHKSGRTRN